MVPVLFLLDLLAKLVRLAYVLAVIGISVVCFNNVLRDTGNYLGGLIHFLVFIAQQLVSDTYSIVCVH